MCVVSMIADHYDRKWKGGNYYDIVQGYNQLSMITRQEFDALKKEVLEMKELLKKAKIYDNEHNQPNCETEDKINHIKKIAEAVGISLDDINIGSKCPPGI